MVILGIDPGTERVGYGVIRKEKGSVAFVEAGILAVRSKDASERLFEIKKGMDALIEKHAPAVASVEKLYFANNRTTGIAVAEARGVILLAAREKNVPVLEFTPTEIKMGVAGHGGADKAAVLKMVKLILKAPALAMIDDASDALAAAITAAQHKVRD